MELDKMQTEFAKLKMEFRWQLIDKVLKLKNRQKLSSILKNDEETRLSV